MQRFNEWLAVNVTRLFGTMWTTYLFFLYGFAPILFPQYMVQLLYWSNTIQLWSLPLLMVGTNLLGRAAEERAQKDHEMINAEFQQINDMLALLHEEIKLQREENQEIRAMLEDVREIKACVDNEAQQLNKLTARIVAEVWRAAKENQPPVVGL